MLKDNPRHAIRRYFYGRAFITRIFNDSKALNIPLKDFWPRNSAKLDRSHHSGCLTNAQLDSASTNTIKIRIKQTNWRPAKRLLPMKPVRTARPAATYL